MAAKRPDEGCLHANYANHKPAVVSQRDTEMSRLTQLDMLVVAELFESDPGYVLNFSNRTFAEFFGRELNVDIDLPIYAQGGTSKGKRLRTFLMTVDDAAALSALKSLWDYREGLRQHAGQPEKVPDASGKFQRMLAKLGGSTAGPAPQVTPTSIDMAPLRTELLDLAKLAPQPRGYAFEKFLAKFFDAFGMRPRQPFRLRGEQIDGSFELGADTYLLEAKWQNGLTDAADLRAFNGKVEEKAAWSRGLLLSYSGFSQDGLFAFGRRKSVVCMDGRDLHDVLDRGLSLPSVLSTKVRHAAETGSPFARVADLF